MPKGVLFETETNGTLTQIDDSVLNKIKGSAKVNGGVIELSFTLILDNASIVNKPGTLTKQAFWPLDGNFEMELKNPETVLTQKGNDKPASFQIKVDWPDGNIGGAGALKAPREIEKEEDRS